MMTVLSVAAILLAFGGLFSLLDSQRVSSSVSDYLRCEYNMTDARSMTVSGLRNL